MGTKSRPAVRKVRPGATEAIRAPRKRAEQQRAQSTRTTILEAALSEFAERGFEAASLRRIADRTGFQHPLITYHYSSKDLLWQAVAVDAFERVRREWDEQALADGDLSALERLQAEYRALFRHTVRFPEFHRFMRQETATDNPRLRWVAENVLKPLIDRLLPHIEAAQDAGLLPAVEPILFHYMMVSLTATLSEFGPEMRLTRRLSADHPKVADAFWKLVEETVFGDPRASAPRRRRRA